VSKNASDRLAARCGLVGILRRYYRPTGRKVNPGARIIEYCRLDPGVVNMSTDITRCSSALWAIAMKETLIGRTTTGLCRP